MLSSRPSVFIEIWMMEDSVPPAEYGLSNEMLTTSRVRMLTNPVIPTIESYINQQL